MGIMLGAPKTLSEVAMTFKARATETCGVSW